MKQTLITTALALALGFLSSPSFAGSYTVNGRAASPAAFSRVPGWSTAMASRRLSTRPSPLRLRPSPAARSAITSSTYCSATELDSRPIRSSGRRLRLDKFTKALGRGHRQQGLPTTILNPMLWRCSYLPKRRLPRSAPPTSSVASFRRSWNCVGYFRVLITSRLLGNASTPSRVVRAPRLPVAGERSTGFDVRPRPTSRGADHGSRTRQRCRRQGQRRIYRRNRPALHASSTHYR
jgi:hypothetical protein